MRVLVLNAYSAGNRGDRMIVDSMIQLFRARDCTVRVSSDDPRDASRYDAPVELSPIPVWPEDGSTPRARMLLGATRTVFRPTSLESLRWADVCVSAGGGYLYDDGSRSARVNLLRRLAILRAARHMGPVVLFSQSIGPFESGSLERLAAAELRQADLVIARERLSLEACRGMGVTHVELHDDAAFALARDPAALPAHRDGVAVTVMADLPGRPPHAVAQYRGALRDGLTTALTGSGKRVVVASQVDAHQGDSDIDAGRSLVRDLERLGLDASFVDLTDLPDDELVDFYGRFECVVASRLHSAILALCAGTPALALAYLPKTTGVYDRIGLPGLVLALDDLDSGSLARAVTATLGSLSDHRTTLERMLPQLRASAERAADRAVAVGAAGSICLAS